MEKNKGANERRTLVSLAVAAEDIGFPFAAQAARLTRQRTGRTDETVDLLTDLETWELPAGQWLLANRQGWGIENGSPQRLDLTLNDDRGWVRSTNGLWILGMVRRLVVSLYLHWRAKQPRPDPHRLPVGHGRGQPGPGLRLSHPPPPKTCLRRS